MTLARAVQIILAVCGMASVMVLTAVFIAIIIGFGYSIWRELIE